MVCGTADILMKFLSLDWFGLGYDCFCKRLHARKLIGKASPKEAKKRGFLAFDLFAMLGVEVLVCLIPPHPPRGTGVGGAGSGS